MSETTERLNLPTILAAQAQKHVTHNEALVVLDALVQLSARSRTRAAPPETASSGDRFVVGAPAIGAWTGREGSIAEFDGRGYAFRQPREGWLAWIEDEARLTVFDRGTWREACPFDLEALKAHLADGSVPLLGVGTGADGYNRLSVKTSGFLVSHDDQSGSGSGSVLVDLNKKGSAFDAGLSLKVGYSARALMGLFGSDDFVLKVSADGNAFHDAIAVDRTTGITRLTTLSFLVRLAADRPVAAGSPVKLGFDAVDWNDGDGFDPAAGLFQPPQGRYRLQAVLALGAAENAGEAEIAIYRNGSVYASVARSLPAAGESLVIDALVGADGSDYFELYLTLPAARTLASASSRTWFGGHAV